MAEVNRSVTVTITADDYAVANKLFVLKSFKRVIVVLLLVVALYAAVLLAHATGYALGGFGDAIRYLTPFALAGSIIVMLLTYFVVAPRRARSTYQKQKTLHYPYTFSWSEAGLKTTGASGEWTMPWSDYFKLVENNKTILFYQSPRMFQMLPKRVLDAGQIADILQCAVSLPR
jgi:hypothetical protein